LNALTNSGLLLASANLTLQGHRRSIGDDGIVSAFEIAGMDLQGTDLVVLSACETGLGQEGAGGRLRGLRTSFTAAGARSVIASMWSVNDPATAYMMTSFYNNWLRTGDKYAALRQAAKDLRDNQNHPEPFYWAPFVLFSVDGK
jgi:CHAT domain-containing protein